MNFLKAFLKGNEVSNAEGVKTWQNRVNALSVVSVAAVQASSAFGLHLPVSEDSISHITNSIISVLPILNMVMTTISSKRVGL